VSFKISFKTYLMPFET